MRNKLNKNFEIVNTVQQTIQCKQLVNPDEYALLAVSGGQDSIGLLITFYFLKTQWNWMGGMIWCHHLWQKDSFYTMVQLARLGFCFQLPTYFAINSDVSSTSSVRLLSKPRKGVASPPLVEPKAMTNLVCFPAFTTSEANAFKDLKNMRRPPKVFAPPKVEGESKDMKYLRLLPSTPPKVVGGEKEKVKEGARKDNKGFKTSKTVFTEKNARDWRHRLNQRICFFYNYNFCVQGHNGSDRVETVLFNLMRGSGKNGVCALQWTQSRVPFSLNKFYCSDSQQFRNPVHKLRMKTKYYYQVKSVLNVSSYPFERTL
jgi:hypothetical protein